jgi:PAS domain S-box-containing protein
MLGYTQEDWRTLDGWIATVHPGDRARIRQFVAETIGIRDAFETEYRVLRPDGTIRWVRAHGAVVSRDASGTPLEYQGLVLDVTATRHARDEALEASALYRSLIEKLPAATYIELAGGSADDVHLTYLSPQIEGIFGRPAEELLADPGHFAKMLHPDDRDRVLAADDRSGETGEPFDCEFRIVRDDDTIAWVHSRATLVRDWDGTPLFWHGVAIDITAQREAEASIRELQEQVLVLEEHADRRVDG